MPLFLIVLLLAPLLEIYLAMRWLFSSPLAAGLYLAGAAIIGALLMKFAKIGVREAMRMLSDGGAPIGAAISFIKIWLAGALLFFPGYITDALAILILLLPSPRTSHSRSRPMEDSATRPLEAQAEIISESESESKFESESGFESESESESKK